jgi:hypothetical protein
MGADAYEHMDGDHRGVSVVRCHGVLIFLHLNAEQLLAYFLCPCVKNSLQ